MPRNAVPLGIVETSGAGASADNCASRIERACATGPSASGTSRSVGTRCSPSSDRKNRVALIFGTAGVGAAPGVAAGSTVAVTPAGFVNRRFNPYITATANATAASAMTAIAAHCSSVGDFILIGSGCQLRFLIGVGQIADLDERRRHVGADEHAERRLLNRARAHF